MNKLYFGTIFTLLLFAMFGANAQTIRYVKAGASGTGASWATASGDLQAMITASAAGDKVFVGAGTYLPTVIATNGTTDRDKAFSMKSGVEIYGGCAGTETTVAALASRNFTSTVSILSGDLGVANTVTDNAYHVIVSAGDMGNTTTGPLAKLDGFTITKGYASGTTQTLTSNSQTIPQGRAGALYCIGGSPTFSNLIITDNANTVVGQNAGAVYLLSCSSKFSNVVFSNNTSIALGGAIYTFGNTTIGTNPTFDNVTFSGNTGTSGGAIYVSAVSAPVFNNCNFTNNTVTTTGGAIYLGATSSTLTINVGSFINNKSGGSSGAIYLGSTTLAPSLNNVTFNVNEATGSAGALYVSSNSATLTNVKFIGNKATVSGGAMYVFGSTGSLGAPTIINSIFYNNQVASLSAGGGAIFASSSTSSNIINSTFYSNSTLGSGGVINLGFSSSVMNIYNSILYANSSNNASTADISNSGTGNLLVKNSITQVYEGVAGNIVKTGVNPKFVSTVPTDINFLQLTNDDNPAIDDGSNGLLPSNINKDLVGNDRIQNSTVDMGALEFSGLQNVAPLTVSINENTPNGTTVVQATTTIIGTKIWKITEGNTENAFAISATGLITVSNSTVLDFETIKSFSLKVNISDGTLSQNVKVIINLINLLEDPRVPIIDQVQNGILNSFKPKLSGFAEPNSNVILFVDGVPVNASILSDINTGKWEYIFTTELSKGIHTFYVTSSNVLGTSNPSPSVTVNLKLYTGVLIPNNLLTPNGDGKNDTWKIANLTLMYPKNEVIVYNKVGKIVFQQNNYKETWDGTFNGEPLPAGTYYYNLNIGNGLDRVKGTITILYRK